jgi:hypothetical protein
MGYYVTAFFIINLFCLFFAIKSAASYERITLGILVILLGLLPLGIYLVLDGYKGWGITCIIAGSLIALFMAFLVFVDLYMEAACAGNGGC